tara:strand:- start:465 stop:653 length:189 start_codon:yes stop_codon:yes gene_type:complete
MDKQSLEPIPEESIYNFIDLHGLRRFLIDYPNMLLMFEILINHIHEFKTLKDTSNISKSSHI